MALQVRDQPMEMKIKTSGLVHVAPALKDDPHKKFWKDASRKSELPNSRCKKLEEEVEALCASISVPASCEFSPHIVSAKGVGTYHVTNDYTLLGEEDVITKCGWPYLKWNSPHTKVDNIPQEIDCASASAALQVKEALGGLEPRAVDMTGLLHLCLCHMGVFFWGLALGLVPHGKTAQRTCSLGCPALGCRHPSFRLLTEARHRRSENKH